MSPELSVVLPCWNEEAALPGAVAVYLSALPASGVESFEVLIVNDASTDRSGAIADELARSDPRVRVLHHERNQGQVAGILNGFRAARGEVVTHNGVDLPFDPADTAAMLQVIREGADVVVVERTTREAYGLLRKVLSAGNVALWRLLFGSPFRDHNFVQFYRRAVVAGLPVVSRGVSTVTPELIVRARRAGFRVVARPAAYHRRRSGSSSITVKKVAHAAIETLRLWRGASPAFPPGPCAAPRDV